MVHEGLKIESTHYRPTISRFPQQREQMKIMNQIVHRYVTTSQSHRVLEVGHLLELPLLANTINPMIVLFGSPIEVGILMREDLKPCRDQIWGLGFRVLVWGMGFSIWGL
jgi:hypothetical protein